MFARVIPLCATWALIAACDKVSPVAPPAAGPRPATAPLSSPDAGKASYEMREKCARDSRESYKHAWEEGAGTAGLVTDYTNHYNVKMSKCFMVVTTTYIAKTTEDHTNRLLDVLENRDVGVVQWFTNKAPSVCQVNGVLCSSPSGWDALVRAYMEE